MSFYKFLAAVFLNSDFYFKFVFYKVNPVGKFVGVELYVYIYNIKSICEVESIFFAYGFKWKKKTLIWCDMVKKLG